MSIARIYPRPNVAPRSRAISSRSTSRESALPMAQLHGARLVMVDDDREHSDRQLDQCFGAVRNVSVKAKRVAGREHVALLAVLVAELSFEQVDEFGPRVLE